MKQVALIYSSGKLIFASEVRDEDSVNFLELKKEAEKNLIAYIKDYEKTKSEITDLKYEIELLKEQIKVLKGED